ncbi:MAG: NTP transferase domain-containing protein [Polyangiaceae bacterium]|nr:NTP transferase domain-containing protein [Polyangiaceae bacterium]MCW5791546.1 NTP transferase domain-containing protein [Polyangiaceae bacterium]
MTLAAMVLCAGFGTRLRPLTEERPKPLVPLGDHPLLAHVTRRLAQAGVTELKLNVHHLKEEFDNLINELEIRPQVIHEPEIRGTAGGVAGAGFGARPVLVWNGDIWCDPPLAELCASTAPITLLCAPRAVGEGSVGVGRSKQVVRLRGERFGEEVMGADFVGISRLSAEVVQALPEQGCLIGDVALPRLRGGQPVMTLPFTGEWSDLGTLGSYLEVNSRWLGERPSWVGEGAVIAPEVTLLRSVVGAGARVLGHGALEGCVVWPGAVAEAPARGTVFGLTVRASLG